MPTDRFVDVLLWPKLLERLSPALRDLYARRFNKRLLHFITLPPDQWQDRFAEQGLRVVRCDGFFSRRTGHLWSVLTVQAFRSLGALRIVDNRLVANGASALWRRLLMRAVLEDPKGGPEFGYLFLVAQKDRGGTPASDRALPGG